MNKKLNEISGNVQTKTVCKKQSGKKVDSLPDTQAQAYEQIVKANVVKYGATKSTPGRIYNDLVGKFKGNWVVIMGQGSYYRLPPFQLHCIVILRNTATVAIAQLV